MKKYLGITPVRKLSETSQQKCNRINALFDAIVHERNIRECKVFEGTYPEDIERAHRELFEFLNDVRKCSKKVLTYAQKLLNENKK